MYNISKMIATEFANSTKMVAAEFASFTKFLIVAETDILKKKEKANGRVVKVFGINVTQKFKIAKK